MRLKDAVISAPPQFGLNNNQLQRNPVHTVDSEENINQNTPPLSHDQEDAEDFRIAEDTTTWSSVAITRDYSNTDSNIRRNINNNLSVPRIYQSSSAESLADCEGFYDDPSQDLPPYGISDWSEEGNLTGSCRGIINPNYPGFQHLGPSLLSDTELAEDEQQSFDCTRTTEANHAFNEYNNNVDVQYIVDNVNHLAGQKTELKFFYEKPKFNIQTVSSLCKSPVLSSEKCVNYVNSVEESSNEEEPITDSTDLQADTGIANEDDTQLTSLESTENEVNSVVEKTSELFKLGIEDNQLREVPVEVEIVELSTSVKETLQFPEIEDISDSSKASEVSEADDILVEQIDLIREAKDLPRPASKIGGQPSVSIPNSVEDSESNSDTDGSSEEQPSYKKLEEIDLLSSIGRDIGIDLEKYVQPVPDVVAMESMNIRASRSVSGPGLIKEIINEDTNKILDRESLEDTGVNAKKKEKMARNHARRRMQSSHYSNVQRRSDKRRSDTDNGPGGFDVYNIETAMPKIDLDAIESHLRAAREEERRENERVAEVVEAVISGREPAAKNPHKEDLLARFDRIARGEFDVSEQRRNDREEIRRRLAMGPDADDLRSERGRKPSLQSRLQSGMNLQICFMNETSSDTESPGSENDVAPVSTQSTTMSKQSRQMPARPQVLNLPPLRVDTGFSSAPVDEADFFARQARLQTEARMALAQAKEMAHMQMEVERQRLKQSPITEMVRCSLEKIGVQLGEERRRLSRVLLTELNVAQLQVLANDLHARIATLNEALVEGLLRRDDLHMEQDSMLVDVEDLTRYLGAKQESLKKRQAANNHKEQQSVATSYRDRQQQSTSLSTKPSIKPKLINRTFVGLVRK